MTQLVRDLRYALRGLAKSPSFSSVSVTILALGIGANSLLFTFFNAYILRPLPFEHPERNVEIRARGENNRFRGFWSYPDFARLAAADGVFDAAYGYAHFEAPSPETARPLKGVAVTANLFPLLRARMSLGRPFRPEEDSVPGRDAVLVLSHAAWRRAFNGDPAILGKSIRIRGRAFTVIGVAGPNFTGLDPITPDCWAPLAMFEQLAPGRGRITDPRDVWIIAGGILRPGVSVSRAAQALTAIAHAAGQDRPPAVAVQRVDLTPRRAFVVLVPSVLTVVLLIAAAFGLVLLIACANLAGIMLARAAAREREIAIRLALGASRARIAGQLLSESVLLAVVAAAPALALAWWGIGPVQRLLFSVLLRQGFTVQPIAPDWRVFLFTFALAAAAGVLFGLAPGFQAGAGSLAARVKQQPAAALRSRRVREALVAGQIATSLALLLLAAFFVQRVRGVNRADPGFDVEHVLDVRPDAPRQPLLALLRRDPAFLLASEIYRTPLYGTATRMPAVVDGRAWPVVYNYVDEHYFSALGIPLRRGRGFAREDVRPDSRHAIVSEATARLLWPGRDPLGATFQVSEPEGSARFAGGTYSVVGVAADVISIDVSQGVDRTAVYLPAVPVDPRNTGLIVRIAGNAASAAPRLRTLCASVAPGASCEPVALSALVSLQRSPYAIAGGVASAVGGLALLLTSIGLYGVVAYSVVQRRREIGIRMALGATRAGILGLVLRECGRRVALGLALGLPVCLALARVAQASFLTLDTSDTVAFVAAPLVLASVAFLACFAPARRAAACDPALILKQD